MEGIGIYSINFLQLLLTSSFFILGGWLMNGKKQMTYRTAFMSLFLGLISMSTVFAIYITGGKTVMLGFLFVLIGLFWENQKTKQRKEFFRSNQVSLLYGLLFGAAFVFTWAFLTIVQFDDFPYHIPRGAALNQNDYIVNAFRSFYLGFTGEENYYHVFNVLDASYHSPKPYHYLEMWTAVSVNSIFGGLVTEKFVLVSNTLYNLTTFVGFLALLEKYSPVKWFHLIFCAAFFFVAGLHLPFYSLIGIPDFSLPVFTHRAKMCVYYPFILGFIIHFEKETPQRSILILSGLMLATVVVAPAIIGGVSLFLFYHLIVRRNVNNALIGWSYMAVVSLFVFVFYALTDTGQFNIRANAGASDLATNLLDLIFANPSQLIMSFVKVLINEFFLYFPLSILLGFVYFNSKDFYRNKEGFILLCGGLIFCGAIAYAIFADEKDAGQLFYNISNSLLNCLLIYVFILLISRFNENIDYSKNAKKYCILASIVGLIVAVHFFKAIKRNIYPSISKEYYSDRYLNKIKEYILLDNKPNLGAAIKGEDDYSSSFSSQTAAYTLAYYLGYIENGSMAINISDLDIKNSDDDRKRDSSSNLFYRFAQDQKKKNQFESVGKSQLDFIEKYNIDFMVISKNGNLRSELIQLIKEEIEDEISGERFLIIR